MIVHFLQCGCNVIAERGRHIGSGSDDPAEPGHRGNCQQHVGDLVLARTRRHRPSDGPLQAYSRRRSATHAPTLSSIAVFGSRADVVARSSPSPCTRAVSVPQSEHATARPGVLARARIASPASWTSSMTTADNSENTVLTSQVTSLMANRDRIGQHVTTESATEPLKLESLRLRRWIAFSRPCWLPASWGPPPGGGVGQFVQGHRLRQGGLVSSSTTRRDDTREDR